MRTTLDIYDMIIGPLLPSSGETGPMTIGEYKAREARLVSFIVGMFMGMELSDEKVMKLIEQIKKLSIKPSK